MERIEISVVDNIRQMYEELFSAEKKVAKYILENRQEVVMLSVSELAHKSGASEATVVRMCKHLGYDGYFQMRLLMSRDAGQYKSPRPATGIPVSSRQIFAGDSERIQGLFESVSTEALLKAADLLIKAETIHIVSVGNNIPIVWDLGFRLERNGQKCTYSILPEQFFNHISLGSCNDVIYAISRSGSSTQVIRAVELAHKKRMKIIIVTGELNKPLVEHADCVLRVLEKKDNPMSGMRPDSHLLEFAVNDALLFAVKNYHMIVDNLNGEESGEAVNDVDLLLSKYKL
ncbi:MAG: MurR/RpiR family transcriptional regulator [Lachnospiraceae bacterium]|nr:MurR/RpiR family transcriptional regulator [Lachnospiraceae bacterium]